MFFLLTSFIKPTKPQKLAFEDHHNCLDSKPVHSLHYIITIVN